MKTLLSAFIIATAVAGFGQSDKPSAPSAPERPPVVTAPPPQPASTPAPTYEYEQRAVVPAAPAPLVSADQAQLIVDKFKVAYAKLGYPRLLIYVNRHLVDEISGLKLTARTEKVEGATGNETTARESRYRRTERKESLADRQTVRDIERLFGRPFRMAGARLADQQLATQLTPDSPGQSPGTEGEQARKDHEALAKIADVAVEILVSSKKVDTYELPDIQVTAIRLKDSEIIGQASSSDVLRGPASTAARNYDVRQITEAVALVLMEDMLPAAEAVK